MATVSHVINSTRYVSPELTERVRVAMQELSYQPDVVARSLRRRQTLTIGLLVPSTEIPFFASVAHSIERAASNKGYNTILCNSEWELTRELSHLGDLMARKVDGLVCISATITSKQIRHVVDSGTPVVMFERQLPHSDLDAVGIDNFQGAYLATRHLLELGHRKLGFIVGLASSSLSIERLEGCSRALAEVGLTLDDAHLFSGDYWPKSGVVATRAALALPDPPTAIFAFNDLMAMGVLQVLSQERLQAPEDMAVVGFDGIPLTQYTSPPLTTVRQPLVEMARAAVDLLLERITGDGPPAAQILHLEPELIVRASTVPCRAVAANG